MRWITATIMTGFLLITCPIPVFALKLSDITNYRFIVDVLDRYGLSHQCETCDWGVNEFDD